MKVECPETQPGSEGSLRPLRSLSSFANPLYPGHSTSETVRYRVPARMASALTFPGPSPQGLLCLDCLRHKKICLSLSHVKCLLRLLIWELI